MKLSQTTKIWLWAIGIVLGLLTLLLVLTITLKLSWWIFFGFLFFFIIAGIAVGLILILTRGKKRIFPRTRAHPKSAVQAVRLKLKTDEDDPDEFIVEEEKMPTEGQPGTEKTNELYLKGRGYWSNQLIYVYVDLDNLDRIQVLRGEPTSDELKEAQRSFALNPSIEETEEENITSPETGKVVRTIVRKKQTLAQKKEEKEKKEAEQKEAL